MKHLILYESVKKKNRFFFNWSCSLRFLRSILKVKMKIQGVKSVGYLFVCFSWKFI